uniref:Phospholipase D n=1 Tax=Agrobacterium albertimagni TaxID=147266 RepID=A0A7C1SYV8_9HYPH
MTAYEPRLIWNNDPNHASEIKDRLADAERFVCMVAFAKESGFKEFQGELREAIERGMAARFVIGVDFYQSEPKVIDKLFKLKRSGDVALYMGSPDKQYTFHPKLFMFEKEGVTDVIVGSANWTYGGMAENHELSVAFGTKLSKVSSEIVGWINRLVDEGEIVEVTPAYLADYARRHAIYSSRMKLAQKRAERAAADPKGGIGTLAEILAEMKADGSYDGFDQAVARRSASNLEGLEILKQIAASGSQSADGFLEQFNRLLDTFHSSGLRRGNSAVARDRVAFKEGVRSILEFSERDPGDMFDHLLDYFKSVHRGGINLLTEILQLLDKRHYAVMNQNSVAGISLAGHTEFPKMPGKHNTTAETYADFCRRAEDIRTHLGLSDLSQLDALFNYAYWNREEEEA